MQPDPQVLRCAIAAARAFLLAGKQITPAVVAAREAMTLQQQAVRELKKAD